MNLVDRLRSLRRRSGLSQRDVALRSGIGIKTVSSFETGQRISSMKISQLRQLLDVYGVSEAEFFAPAHEEIMNDDLFERFEMLPAELQNQLLDRYRHLAGAAVGAGSDWHLLNSRN